MLTKPHDAGYGLTVWSPQGAARQIAPMITPAYPAMNSTLSVSRQTLQILQAEFERGHAIVDSFWKSYNANPDAEINWSILFEPSDFFILYPVIGCVFSIAHIFGSYTLTWTRLFLTYSTIFPSVLLVHHKVRHRLGVGLLNLVYANLYRINSVAVCR